MKYKIEIKKLKKEYKVFVLIIDAKRNKSILHHKKGLIIKYSITAELITDWNADL